MNSTFIVFLGGGIGALARHLLSGYAHKFSDGIFPLGTLVVNLTGCLIIGCLWAASERFIFSPSMRTFLFIGILGGFTTFSSFGIETFNLLRNNEVMFAVVYVLLSNVVGLGLVYFGVRLGAAFL